MGTRLTASLVALDVLRALRSLDFLSNTEGEEHVGHDLQSSLMVLFFNQLNNNEKGS